MFRTSLILAFILGNRWGCIIVFRRVVCLLLFVTLLCTSAFATYVPGASDIVVDGANGESVAELNQEASTFSVTVPSSLPAYMDDMGNVTVASNARIVNNGVGPVVVSNFDIEPIEPWGIVWTEDPSELRVGSKLFSLSLNGGPVHSNGSSGGGAPSYVAYTSNLGEIDGNGGAVVLDYDLSLAP